MILVTGAAGKTGRAIINALVRHGFSVRAWVRRADQEERVREVGAREVLWGDLLNPSVLERSCQGVCGIYHICPNVHPDELPIGCAIIAAAQKAHVGRFVYHSVLHPQTQAMPHHWRKLLVEEHLLRSNLDWTILRPGAYMQNLLTSRERLMEGIYPVPYALTSRIALVDLVDVAAVAVRVLSTPSHTHATYELCSGDAPDQHETAAILEEVLGLPVRATVLDRKIWSEQARAMGLSENAIEALLAMFCYYEKYGLRGNKNALGWLLERPPTSLRSFLKRAFQQ